MTEITTIGLGFQIMIGLIFICIAMVYVGFGIVEQMKRRNDLTEAELRSKGVPLNDLPND